MGPIQVVVQDGNNLVLEVTPTPSTTVILDRGIPGPVGPMGDGDVDGPASSTDNAVARFDGTTGKLIQNSLVTVSDTGAVAGVTTLAASGAVTLSGGTANGVAYLNGSKVLTTGSALTFDGTNLSTPNLILPQTAWTLGTVAANASIVGYGSTGSGGTTNTLVFNTGTSEQMRLTSTGLGIGTSAPSAKLQVSSNAYMAHFGEGTGSAGIDFKNRLATLPTTGTVATIAWLENTSGFTAGSLLLGSRPGTGHVVLSATGAADVVVSTTNGNLGIGTSSPSAKLDVATTTGFTFGSTSLAGVKVGTQGAVGGSFMVQTPSLNNSFGSGLAVDGTYAGGKSTINLKAFGVYSNGPYSSDFAFFTSTTTTLSEKMRLDSSGNLGIGTSSPQARLEVSGAGQLFINQDQRLEWNIAGSNTIRANIRGTSGNALVFGNRVGDVLTDTMTLDASGNLLVGTTSNQTGAKVNAAGGVGTSNPATGRFATVEYGSGASGSFTTITISFTVSGSSSPSVILEVLMTGFSSVYLDHVAARYSNQAAVVMRNNASGGTTVASLAYDNAGTYTLTITTSVSNPVVKVKATAGGLGSSTTLPTITFA